MSNIIALIGARSGSKSVPDKNIRMLGEHPMMAYSIKAAQKCKQIDRVIVSTDSNKYADIARQYNAEVIMRPEEISGDDSTDYEFVNHALNCLERIESTLPDLIVHLRPTTPIRNPFTVGMAIKVMQERADRYTSVRSVHEMPESAYKCFEIKDEMLAAIGSDQLGPSIDYSNGPRQQFPKTYQPNGYVDVLDVSFIKECKMLHGDFVYAFLTNPVIEVDTIEDFECLESVLKPDYIKNLFE